MSEWNKCPGCSATVNSSADYCPNCGEPWTVKCHQCNATFRFWKLHNFCPDCGAPMERHGVVAGEQRQQAARR